MYEEYKLWDMSCVTWLELIYTDMSIYFYKILNQSKNLFNLKTQVLYSLIFEIVPIFSHIKSGNTGICEKWSISETWSGI